MSQWDKWLDSPTQKQNTRKARHHFDDNEEIVERRKPKRKQHRPRHQKEFDYYSEEYND